MSIIEVAKAAGVSTATVSRVLNGLPGVREETIAQVKAAVSQLSYKPQRTRSPKKKPARAPKLRLGTIAIVTVGHDRSWLEIPVLAAVVSGVQRGCNSADVRLMLGEMPDVSKLIPLLTDKQIDGAIVFLSSEVPPSKCDAVFKAMQRHVPIVWAMGMEMSVSGVDHVTPHNVGIGNLAFSHLKNLGCKRVAYLAANPGWPFLRLRGQSFINSAVDEGLSPGAYLVGEDGPIAQAYGRNVTVASSLEELIKKLAHSPNRPDGLFVATDATTSHIYPLLAEHGVRVGKDIHIVSCDNERIRLTSMHPQPASIDIGSEEIGFRAVNRLFNRIDRPNGPPLIIQVSPRLQLPPIGS